MGSVVAPGWLKSLPPACGRKRLAEGQDGWAAQYEQHGFA